MRRWLIWSAVALGLLVLGVNAVAAYVYFYDRSHADRLAKGVTIAGIDVGGLRADAARTRIQRRLVPRLERPFALAYRGRRFVIEPVAAGLSVDVDRMVDTALRQTRHDDLLHRFLRDVRGRPLHASVPLKAAYSPGSVSRFVRRIARSVDRPARSARVVPNAAAVSVVPSHTGIAVRRGLLIRELERRILDPRSDRVLSLPMRVVRPAVATADLPRRYPAFITVNREAYRLTLWRRLKPFRSYPIAVGRQGLETPAGLYRINDKQIDPSWHVPKSPWAGDLAGRVIPPGPDDPLKARWLGFYNGAGIHGTSDIGSLGSAASHGCIRMSIPDVIQLYDLVPYGTPIYIG